MGDVVNISSGQNVPNEEMGEYINLTMGSVDVDGNLIYSLRTNKKDKILKKDNLIMPTRDVGAGLVIGRTAVIDEDDLYYAGNCLYILDVIDNYSYFIHYYMNGEKARGSMRGIISGGSQKQITLPTIKAIDIPICRKEEQIKIGTYFKHLDNLIALHQRK